MTVIYLALAVSSFFGSFLLFVIQPLAAKLVLPLYGGSALVWIAVVCFFTTTLALGYFYVAFLTTLSKKRQITIHASLLLVSIVSTFLLRNIPLPTNLQLPPSLILILQLTKKLGIIIFALSTTSPLIQKWFTNFFPKKSPYWLYALSNAGSLLGLLIYPFAVEPLLGLIPQIQLWKYGIGIYIILVLYIVFRLNKIKIDSQKLNLGPILRSNSILLWLSIPFVTTSLTLSLTTRITQVLTPFPLVWVGTLGVYLFSFALAFTKTPWYSKTFYKIGSLFALALLGFVTSGIVGINFQISFPLSLFLLFFITFTLHKTLYHKRPNTKNLTIYYLLIAIGGSLASIFNSVVAPILLKNIEEYPMGIVLAIILVAHSLIIRSKKSFKTNAKFFAGIFILLTLYQFSGAISTYHAGLINIYNNRNFYGDLHLLKTQKDKPYILQFYNGGTLHGNQHIGGKDEFNATTYYNIEDGLGQAILNHPKKQEQQIRLGIVGLGAGTTAAYCGYGEYIKFYEINPQVVGVAQKYFRYLRNAKQNGCVIDHVLGDARISMQKEAENGDFGEYDVLAIDAFSDDNIPVHLLTLESYDVYKKHLRDGGIVAYHISSRYFDLAPVIEWIAAKNSLYFLDSPGNESHWALVSKTSLGENSHIPQEASLKSKPWTDDYSNILSTLIR